MELSFVFLLLFPLSFCIIFYLFLKKNDFLFYKSIIIIYYYHTMFDLEYHRRFNDILYLLLRPSKHIYFNTHQTEVNKRKNNNIKERLVSSKDCYSNQEIRYVYNFAISIGLKPKRKAVHLLTTENFRKRKDN